MSPLCSQFLALGACREWWERRRIEAHSAHSSLQVSGGRGGGSMSPLCSLYLALGSCRLVGDMMREEWPLCFLFLAPGLCRLVRDMKRGQWPLCFQFLALGSCMLGGI